MFTFAAVASNGFTFAFSLDPAVVVQMILAVFLPLLVGLVTTKVTSSGKKSVLLAALSLATSVITTLSDAIAHSATFDLGAALLFAIPTFVIAVSSHYGLWKPTGAAEAAQGVGSTSVLK